MSTASQRFKIKYNYTNGVLASIQDYTNNVLGPVYWAAVATNARGQVIHEQLQNGLETISTYDRITGALEARTTGPSGGSSIQNLDYVWDKVGNLTRREDLNQGVFETFYYDSLDRLDYSQRNNQTNLDVTYDTIGNITYKSDVGSYSYHPTKKHAVQSTSNGWNFQYDANGNVTSGFGGNVTWYSYNLPKLVGVSGVWSSEFWYAAGRQRYRQRAYYGPQPLK